MHNIPIAISNACIGSTHSAQYYWNYEVEGTLLYTCVEAQTYHYNIIASTEQVSVGGSDCLLILVTSLLTKIIAKFN